MSHSGIYTDNTHSYINFGMCYASKNVGLPTKRTVKKSIPYRDGSIDFTMLYGRNYYDERTVTYTFEEIGDTASELQMRVDLFSEWLLSLTDCDIYDDELHFWHWHGSCDSVSVDYDADGLKATISVAFSFYPFKIANEYTNVHVIVGNNTIINEGQPARIYAIPDGASTTFLIDGVRQTFTGAVLSDLVLPHGTSIVTVTGGAATLRWREERI